MQKIVSKTYTQEQLIKDTALSFNKEISIEMVKTVIKQFEKIMKSHLSEAKPTQTIECKPFAGVLVSAKYQPAKQKTLNYTDGETVDVPERIKVNARATNYLTFKITRGNIDITPKLYFSTKEIDDDNDEIFDNDEEIDNDDYEIGDLTGLTVTVVDDEVTSDE